MAQWTDDLREELALDRKADDCCGLGLILVITWRLGLGWTQPVNKTKKI